LTVNGAAVRDVIELRFQSAEESLRLTWRDARGTERRMALTLAPGEGLGVEAHPFTIRACNNRCVFCFVHQNPKRMRRGLYFKDEDYRMSFLAGHYITLTNLTEADLDRIVTQRLSPLYVSVHATEVALRNRILGNPQAPDPLPQLRRMAASRITLHCQVVVCPGLNDGSHLARTVEDLADLFPAAASVALVPVGLTAHREGLPPLTPPTPADARDLIATTECWQRAYRHRLGTRFVFPSDEFFLLANLPVPGAGYYEGFPLRENGVGMVRHFLREAGRLLRHLPATLPIPRHVTAVTGELAAPVLAPVIERLNRIGGLRVEAAVLPNTFYGGTISAAGLLTGGDILKALRSRHLGEAILLPEVCFRHDRDVFLDDLSLEDLAAALGVPALKVPATARGLIRVALGWEGIGAWRDPPPPGRIPSDC
jgi:putative radical SAM enzyme (TIGR03279 family)